MKEAKAPTATAIQVRIENVSSSQAPCETRQDRKKIQRVGYKPVAGDEQTSDPAQRFHRAALLIRSQLPHPPAVSKIAKEVGCTASHLGRLFRQHYGGTVQQYIRRERARATLNDLAFTDKPIKVVALSVGLLNLQQFNKLIRAEFGCSPRELRDRYQHTFTPSPQKPNATEN